MCEKLLAVLLGLLERTSTFEDSLLFSLQLLAWIKLSSAESIPANLRYQPHGSSLTVHEVALAFQQLAARLHVNNDFWVFGYFPESIKSIGPVKLTQLLRAIGEEPVAWPCSVVDLIDYVSLLRNAHLSDRVDIAPEVANLIISLAAIADGQTTYLPFANLQLAYRAGQYTTQLFAVSQQYTLLPGLLNILGDSSVELATGDELASPLFVEEGRLRQFDITVAFPPFGIRVREDFSRGDKYRRFPESTSSFGVLAIRHIVATTQGRAIVVVPNGILFSTGTEQALRAYLLQAQVVEGVIALPPALLPGSPVLFSLLILNTAVLQSEVFFVDGTKPVFSERDGKGRSVLSGWETLRDLYFTRQAGAFSCLVPAEEVRRGGTNLLPARYCLDTEVVATRQLLTAYATACLRDVVEFVRPAALADKAGAVVVTEVGGGDFPEFGYLQPTGRPIRTTEPLLTRAEQRGLLLQGHDILLTMKGAAGKVALVAPQSTATWTASLACLVLRVNPTRLDARVLFVFLKSAAGQSLLKQIISMGATVALIQLRDLEKLPVPIPTTAEQQLLIDGFEQLVILEREIGLLRAQQLTITENFWG